MTATFNPAWRLILRLLLVVVCVKLCSCQKVSPTSNLEGNHITFPAPGVGVLEKTPEGAEQEIPANNLAVESDVVEEPEPPTKTAKSTESNIVMPVIVSSGGNEGIKNSVEEGSDKPSQDNYNCNQSTNPKPDSTTDSDAPNPSQNIRKDATPSGTKDALANMNITEFIQTHCGKAHSRKRRIVGGTISSVTYYPWTVGIFMDGSSKPYCGAVLVTPWFVLTAAHCTRGRIAVDLRVAYGLQTINERTLAERQEHVAVVKEIHQHEKFKDIVHGDDISMLQLETPLLVAGQPVPPICTPQLSQLDRSTVVNTTGVVAGWGRTTYIYSLWGFLRSPFPDGCDNDRGSEHSASFAVNSDLFVRQKAAWLGGPSSHSLPGGPLSVLPLGWESLLTGEEAFASTFPAFGRGTRPLSAKQIGCVSATSPTLPRSWLSVTPRLADGESSSDLREVSLPIVSNQECSKVFEGVVAITDGMICAGDITGKKDACQGDSGGPLMWYSSVFERWFVIGVVSFGVKCAEKGYYGTYTWVEKYLSWICKITDGLVCLQTTGDQKKQLTKSKTKAKPVKSKGSKRRPLHNKLSPSRLRKSNRRKWNLKQQE